MTELLGYTAEQVRAAEAPHLAAGEPLMLRAATALAGVIRERLIRRGVGVGARVVLLVGPGNNGGDALFAGAELAEDGADVVVVPVVDGAAHPEGLRAACDAGAALAGVEDLAAVAAPAAVIVDGMFGTGSAGRSALRGAARTAVSVLTSLPRGDRADVVAVDIPSGIGADDGSVPDPMVLPADVTVTFGGIKAGLLLPPAREYAGEVRLVDIGIGDELAGMRPVVRVETD